MFRKYQVHLYVYQVQTLLLDYNSSDPTFPGGCPVTAPSLKYPCSKLIGSELT